MLLAIYQATNFIIYLKLSDLVLLVMSTACDTTIQRYLWFVKGAALAMRERNETPFFLYTKCGSTVCKRNGPTGRNQLGETRQVKDN